MKLSPVWIRPDLSCSLNAVSCNQPDVHPADCLVTDGIWPFPIFPYCSSSSFFRSDISVIQFNLVLIIACIIFSCLCGCVCFRSKTRKSSYRFGSFKNCQLCQTVKTHLQMFIRLLPQISENTVSIVLHIHILSGCFYLSSKSSKNIDSRSSSSSAPASVLSVIAPIFLSSFPYISPTKHLHL